LTATIIALIAAACVLAAVFIYLQGGQNVQVPTAVDQRVQEINESLAKLAGVIPASQEVIQASLKQLSSLNAVKPTQSQIEQSLSQLKAQ
jgi:hypothetical protein